MHVQIASENDKEQWNLFVDSECGSFFQYYDWKYLYEFKKQNRYIPLLIRDSTDSILGIFPIVEQPGPIYPSLSSLPEGASDGFLIKSDLIEQEKIIIIQSFLDFIDANFSGSHSFITVREHLSLSEKTLTPSQILIDNGYMWKNNTAAGLPCTHVLNIERPFEEKIWDSLWSKRLRKRIRHTKKIGADVIIDNNFAYIDDFYAMQIESVKKFGLVERKEKYEQIQKIFKNKIKLFVCVRDKKQISAALCYYTPTMAYLAMAPYYSESKDYLTNTLPICASIHFACDEGYQHYEMGITQTSDLAFHKEKFGARKIPMMIYQKKFSHFKMAANKIARSVIQGGKRMVKLLQ